MANRTIKTAAAMGALLFGAAHAADLDSDEGTYSVDVSVIGTVTMSDDTKATATDANDVLQGVGNNTKTSPLVLEFTVLTNLEEWDLSLKAENGGKLLRTTADKTPLKTDVNSDGSLGDGGSLYVLLKEVLSDDKIKNVTSLTEDGGDVDVKGSRVAQLAPEAFKVAEFLSEGLVEAVFQVRAGLGGDKIIAPPGTYTETVTVTLTGNTN